jgi:hypothetical protein
MEVLGHNGLIHSCYKDRGRVNLQELSRVDSPIIFLPQVGPELAQSDYHAEVRCECHASP